MLVSVECTSIRKNHKLSTHLVVASILTLLSFASRKVDTLGATMLLLVLVFVRPFVPYGFPVSFSAGTGNYGDYPTLHADAPAYLLRVSDFFVRIRGSYCVLAIASTGNEVSPHLGRRRC